MKHEKAKAALAMAATAVQREEAIAEAIRLQMSLSEVEEYLDWLDAVRAMPESAAVPAESLFRSWFPHFGRQANQH